MPESVLEKINRVLAQAALDAPQRYADVIRFMSPRQVGACCLTLDFTRGNHVTDVEYRDTIEYLALEAAIPGAVSICPHFVENTVTIRW